VLSKSFNPVTVALPFSDAKPTKWGAAPRAPQIAAVEVRVSLSLPGSSSASCDGG
jgi:hypothetical protein